jgi:hypothetical protein
MSTLTLLRPPRYLGLALLYVVLAAGCAGMPQPLSGLPFGALLEAPPAPPGPGDKKVSIEVRPASGRPERIELALNQDDSVDTLLARSHVASRFGRMKINLYRPSGKPGGPVHPLKVEFDAYHRHVPVQYDYHLHDGDRIVVTEDPTTAFDATVSGLLGSLRGE